MARRVRIIAAALQIGGLTITVAGCALLWWWLALIVAGVGLLGVGLDIERQVSR